MKGYSQIAALLEKGISVFLLLFGATMVMLMAGLIFVLLSQIGVLVKLSDAVGLIFDSAGSLEARTVDQSFRLVTEANASAALESRRPTQSFLR